MAVHIWPTDAFLPVFAEAAASTASAAAAAAGGGARRRVAFATCDLARWPQLARAVDIDTGLLSEQLPSVLKFVRGGRAVPPPAEGDGAAPSRPGAWLRRLPHVYSDGTTVASSLSLQALRLNFELQ